MAKRWHTIAMEMLDRGETQKYVASVFGVSTSCICQLRGAEKPEPAPDWVPMEFRTDFEQIESECGSAAAREWLKYAIGILNKVPLQPRATHPWNAKRSEAVPS